MDPHLFGAFIDVENAPKLANPAPVLQKQSSTVVADFPDAMEMKTVAGDAQKNRPASEPVLDAQGRPSTPKDLEMSRPSTPQDHETAQVVQSFSKCVAQLSSNVPNFRSC